VYDYDYSYGYEWNRYGSAPLPAPARPERRGLYVDNERSGYDDYGTTGPAYTHNRRQYAEPPPPPRPAESSSGPTSAPRRWIPAPTSSLPRVWEPGPRAAEIDARRAGAREPRQLSGEPSEPAGPSFSRASSEVVVEAGLVVPAESTFGICSCIRTRVVIFDTCQLQYACAYGICIQQGRTVWCVGGSIPA